MVNPHNPSDDYSTEMLVSCGFMRRGFPLAGPTGPSTVAVDPEGPAPGRSGFKETHKARTIPQRTYLVLASELVDDATPRRRRCSCRPRV